jgi:DNA repair exonuclease SbcCD ATPase subunit
MAKYFLKSISIEGFRGINNEGSPLLLNLKSDGVTSIFGENGKGKSSIFEAFLFSLLGRILRFDDYHSDIKDKRTIKNLFHSGEGKIIIEFIDDSNLASDIVIKVNSNGERTSTSTSIPNHETFLSSLSNSLNFLDHKSFEKIILSSSEDTGKLFSNLVGFGKFIDIKEKLDKISRTQNINSDFGKASKEQSIKLNEQKISQLKEDIKIKFDQINIKTEVYNKNEIFRLVKTFVNSQFKINIKKLSSQSDLDFDSLIKNKIGGNYEEDAFNLISKKESVKHLIVLSKSLKNFNTKRLPKLKKDLEKVFLNIESNNELVLGKLYDDAIASYDAIPEFDKNSCVLCLTTDLNQKGNTFYEQINSKITSYFKFKKEYLKFKEKLSRHFLEACVLDYELLHLSETDRIFTKILNSDDYIKPSEFNLNTLQNKLDSYQFDLNEEILEAQRLISELELKVPKKIADLVEKNSVYEFIFKTVFEIEKIKTQNNYDAKYLNEINKWVLFISQLKIEYEDAYNSLMDDIASMIDKDTKIFFKEIMGNVDIVPKLKKENKGQKVNILLENFYGNTTDLKAAPLLSESYRNALSLSIYFSAALKSKNKGNFIIVDDITSSFDSGHQFYLLDLIKNRISLNPSNKKGKQIIFLTHDGILKKVLNENNSLKNWTHYSLNSNQSVVSLTPFKSEDLKTALQAKVNSGNYVGSDFRMFYEFVLLEIIEKLNLEIPFSLINSNDNKMISKLSNAINEIIELKRTAGKTRQINRRLPTKNLFKTQTQQLANNLSHWASGSTLSLTPTLLNRIIDDIDSYKKLFQYNCTCARNAGWVYYNSLSSPKYKNCTCTL